MIAVVRCVIQIIFGEPSTSERLIKCWWIEITTVEKRWMTVLFICVFYWCFRQMNKFLATFEEKLHNKRLFFYFMTYWLFSQIKSLLRWLFIVSTLSKIFKIVSSKELEELNLTNTQYFFLNTIPMYGWTSKQHNSSWLCCVPA